MKRFLFALALFLVATAPAAAVDLRPMRGDRFAVLAVPAEGSERLGEVSELVARAIRKELERKGFQTVVLPRSVDQMVADGIADAVDAAWVVEITYSDGDARSWGGIGTGGEIGDVDVGGEISVVTAALHAELRFYDARTLELIDTYELDSRATSPTISGIGLGGRHSWLWVSLPWMQRHPYSRAAGALAREAVSRILRSSLEIASGGR
jgi:hypothetical protein